MDDIFRFKQFEVNQQHCAMRINTDGVLLAASVQKPSSRRILDIGTGTGVIALMLAQRFVQAEVYAVEIEPKAANTAKQNFQNSPFSSRLNISCIDIADFESDAAFDLIVSNPPFFVNDLKNTDKSKEIARHAKENFFKVLIDKVLELMSDDGEFWLILPVHQAEKFIKNAEQKDLFPKRLIAVHSDGSKKAFRTLMCLSKTKDEALKEQFFIYKAEKQYTTSYKKLLEGYFQVF